MQICISNITDFFRKPKSKKRRILKKWSKRPSNWRPYAGAIVCGNTAYCNPEIAKKLEAIRKEIYEEDDPGKCCGGSIQRHMLFDTRNIGDRPIRVGLKGNLCV